MQFYPTGRVGDAVLPRFLWGVSRRPCPRVLSPVRGSRGRNEATLRGASARCSKAGLWLPQGTGPSLRTPPLLLRVWPDGQRSPRVGVCPGAHPNCWSGPLRWAQLAAVALRTAEGLLQCTWHLGAFHALLPLGGKHFPIFPAWQVPVLQNPDKPSPLGSLSPPAPLLSLRMGQSPSHGHHPSFGGPTPGDSWGCGVPLGPLLDSRSWLESGPFQVLRTVC